jgi:hypothetical protein
LVEKSQRVANAVKEDADAEAAMKEKKGKGMNKY